jgi:hypothetical protein
MKLWEAHVSKRHNTSCLAIFPFKKIVKQDIDKLLIVGFIKPVEEATWLSP